MQPTNQLEEGDSISTARLFRKRDWWVADVDFDISRKLIEDWHYARGAANTATYLHGLFPRDSFWDAECVGVAWWIPPTKSAAHAIFPENWNGVLALSRLAIKDEIPTNAESFLIRHSMRLIDRKRWPCLLSYADEMQGHKGTIYEAAGWKEAGKTKPEPTYRLNGRLISRKAGPKTYTHKQMLERGCEYLGKFSKIRFVHKI